MLSRSTPIAETALRGLHPSSLESSDDVRALFERARAAKCAFHRGLNVRVDLETAELVDVGRDRLYFETRGFDHRDRRQVFLNFELDHRPYFFATERLARSEGTRLEVALPRTVYCAERRDRPRWPPAVEDGDTRNVVLCTPGGGEVAAEVADLSVGGLAVLVRSAEPARPTGMLTVRFVDGARGGETVRAHARSAALDAERPGWMRIGLAEGNSVAEHALQVEAMATIPSALPHGLIVPPLGEREAETDSPEVRVVRFADDRGRPLTGLLDLTDETEGGTAVILQNGWGQTKEALLPLARTLVSTFSAHGRSLSVLRFDGVNKRGESDKDPECRIPGRESHNFVFSQGVRDLRACVQFLQSDAGVRPERIVLISFSAGAIEARKVVAEDAGRTIDGWVSIVGSPDLQSMTRSISGGVDFVAGYDLGLEFGLQELLGVVVDIDRLGRDADTLGVLHLEDARTDMARVGVPVTWFHGQHDAWVDLDRVHDMMSHGTVENRRLITLPMAHRLDSSRQANEAFQVVAHEVARLALGEKLAPVAANPRDLRARRRVERARRPRAAANLRDFWRDYLLGRDGSVGIELMTACSDYRLLMADQIEALDLHGGERVADLGCGTGAFALELLKTPGAVRDLEIVGFDHVPAALRRARERMLAAHAPASLRLDLVAADLDVGAGRIHVPAPTASFDCVLASLLLSYVERPAVLLEEMLRILRPGGRLVLSSLCRDADISRLYVESLAEMRVGDAARGLPELSGGRLDQVARNFLNDAARILEFEEEGAFAFWDPDELTDLLSQAGFQQIEARPSFGTPAQAVVMSARRPATALRAAPEQRASRP